MEDGMSSMDAHSSSWMPGDQFDAPLSRARFNGNFAQQNQFEDYLDSGSDSSDSGTSSYSDWFEFGSGSGDSSDSSDSSYGGDYWDDSSSSSDSLESSSAHSSSSESTDSTSCSPPEEGCCNPECCDGDDGDTEDSIPIEGAGEDPGGCDGEGQIAANPDAPLPDQNSPAPQAFPVSGNRARARSATASSLYPLLLRYSHPMEWRAFYKDGDVRIRKPSGKELYFQHVIGTSKAKRSGTTRSTTSLVRLLNDDGTDCVSKSPGLICLAVGNGSELTFSVKTGLLVSMRSRAGVVTTMEEFKKRLKIEHYGPDGAITSVWTARGGLVTVEYLTTGLKIRKYARSQVYEALGSWHTEGEPYRTWDIRRFKDGGETVTETRSRYRNLPEQVRQKRTAGDDIVIITGEGSERIYESTVRRPMGGNLWERLKMVRRAGDSIPATSSREILEYTDGGWRTLSRTEGYGSEGAITTEYDYDNYRVSLETTTGAGTTRYEYDSEGRVKKTVSPWGRGGRREVMTSYKTGGRFNETRPSVVQEDIVDAKGNRKTLSKKVYSYADGNLVLRTTVTETALGVSGSRTTVEEFYGPEAEPSFARGRMKMRRGPDGVETWYTYEDMGEELLEAEPDSSSSSSDSSASESASSGSSSESSASESSASESSSESSASESSDSESSSESSSECGEPSFQAVLKAAAVSWPVPVRGVRWIKTTEMRVNGAPVSGKSTRTVEYISGDETIRRREEYAHTGLAWSLVSRERYEYDEEGRLVRTERADGRVRTVESMMCSGPLKEIDFDGITTLYSYNSARQLTEMIRSGTETTPETVVSYVRDAQGRVLEEWRSVGAMNTVRYAKYDTMGRMIWQKDELGRVTSWYYSGDGSTVTKTLPSGGIVRTETNEDGSVYTEGGTGSTVLKYEYELTAGGLRTTKMSQDLVEIPSSSLPEDPWTPISRDTVNGFGEIVVQEVPNTLGGWVSTVNSYNSKGFLVSFRTASEAETRVEYDVFGIQNKQIIVLNEQNPASTVSNRIKAMSWRYENRSGSVYRVTEDTVWNAAGAPLTTKTASLVSSLDFLSRDMVVTDVRGMVSRRWTMLGTGPERFERAQSPSSSIIAETRIVDGFVTRSRDAAGITVIQTRSYRQNGIQVKTTDGRGNTTVEDQNVLGWTLKTTDAAGNATEIVYDLGAGKPASIVDAAGKTSFFEYDQRGRTVAEYGTAFQPALYEYDEMNRIAGLTTYGAPGETITGNPKNLPNGRKTLWGYHFGSGLLTVKYDPMFNKSEVYAYDALNRLETKNNHQAQGAVRYAYAPLTGELVEVTYEDGTPGISFEYNLLGQPVSVTDASGTRTVTYNAYGKQETESLEIGGCHYILKETRDGLGRSSGYKLTRDPSAGFDDVDTLLDVYLTYRADGRLGTAGVRLGEGTRTYTYSYLSGSNLLSSVSLPFGLERRYSYEPRRNLLTGITHRTTSGTELVSRTQSYDAVGRPVERTQWRAGEETRCDSFGYNARSELTQTSLGSLGSYGYDYDNNGNRCTSTDVSGTTNYQPNRLDQYTSIERPDKSMVTPEYDNVGNQLKVVTETGEWSLVWNAERRPVTWTSADGKTVVTSAYDSMGRRCRRQVRVNGTLTRDERYLYRGYLRIATLDALNGDALVHAILWDPSEPEATRPLGLTTSDGTHYSYGHDFTKNVTEMLDETGRLVASYEYDPYGRTVIESGSCGHANPLGFSSEITDRETGTMYYNYRDYNPTDGRWLTRDPIGEQGGRNLYGFSRGNSVMYTDCLGLVWWGQQSPPPGQSVLSYKDIFYKADKCGHFRWDIQWEVSNGEESGVVYQDVVMITRLIVCESGEKRGENGRHQESWNMKGSMRDTWSLVNINERVETKTKGTAVFMAKAYYTSTKPSPSYTPNYYFYGIKIEPLCKNGICKADNQHDLQGLDPVYLSNSPTVQSNIIERTLTVTWDCCCRDSKTKLKKE